LSSKSGLAVTIITFEPALVAFFSITFTLLIILAIGVEVLLNTSALLNSPKSNSSPDFFLYVLNS
jgi:hypothetical protein